MKLKEICSQLGLNYISQWDVLKAGYASVSKGKHGSYEYDPVEALKQLGEYRERSKKYARIRTSATEVRARLREILPEAFSPSGQINYRKVYATGWVNVGSANNPTWIHDADQAQEKLIQLRKSTKSSSKQWKKKIQLEDPIGYIKATWTKRKYERVKKGKEFTITPEDLIWPTHCPILGLELDYTGKHPERGWSIDQLDSTKGYVKGNVEIISRRANTIKSYGSELGHQKVQEWMQSKQAV